MTFDDGDVKTVLLQGLGEEASWRRIAVAGSISESRDNEQEEEQQEKPEPVEQGGDPETYCALKKRRRQAGRR